MPDFPDWGTAVRAGTFILAGSGVAIVAVTGTAIPLKSSTICQQVMVKARQTNIGTVYVGTFGVANSEDPIFGGLQLAAGDLIAFPVDNVNNVYVNGAAGDGVSFLFWS